MEVTAPGRRLRASCDFCTKRRRKCDGDGVNRCSFCIAKNQLECHYSVRRLTGARTDGVSRRAPRSSTGKGAKATPSSSGDVGDGGGSSGLISERRDASVLPLKRARLRPSPATGLVGLRENVYVAEFFQTVGFLPFTTESFIRKAMVNTMFRAVQERDPGVHGCSAGFGSQEQEEEEEGGWGDGAVVPRAGPGVAIDSAAGACVLWCTVAMGCLIGGRPKSSVDEYARLARVALSDCFDDGSVQTARAFTSMALLQDAMGNETKFNKYIDYAKSVMRALPAEEVPSDLTESHMLVKACDLYDGFYDQLGEEDLRDARDLLGQAEESIPIQQAELCRWLVRTDIRLSACFAMDMQNPGSCGDLSNAGIQAPCSGPEPASGSGSGLASEPDGDGSGDLLSNIQLHGVHDQVPAPKRELDTPAPRVTRRRPPSGTLAEPPPPGPMSQKFAARILPEVNLMMHATQRSEVRGGIGELKLLTIMAYACLLQGQPDKAIHGLVRCTDIFVEKPGICRAGSWKHLVHCCLACMVVSGNVNKYERLRTSYNSVLEDDVPRAPPFEEFRGMSAICENVMCKSVDNVMKMAAQKGEPSNLCDDVPATSEEETELSHPGIESQDVPIPAYSSVASDESWARGVFAKRWQLADVQAGGSGNKVSLPAGAAAPAAAPAGLGATYGSGHEQHPRGAGVRFGVGPREGPAGSNAASNIGSSNSNSNSVGPVPSGDAAAGTAAPSTAAGQDGIRRLDQQARDGTIPLPLIPSVPPAQASSAAHGPAEAGGNNSGNGSGGLELLRSSELEAAEAAGLLDAVDALLGEAVSEGFGQTSSEEDSAPAL